MEKLTLKEIAGYLPYKLQIKSNITGTIFEMVGISFRESIQDSNGFDVVKIESCKPLLYPLEMLTKTIVHNGVEIIPIVELYKISNEYTYKTEIDYEFVLSWGKSEILKVFHDREKDEYTEFIIGNLGFRKDRRYSKGHNVYGVELPHPIRVNEKIYNQFKINELLLEWHFDIHGLIPIGLAIDKSTLNSK